MEKHIRIVGNIFIAKGFLSFCWIAFAASLIPNLPFLFFLVLPNVVVGIALKRHLPWSRSAAICLSAMNLPYLPLGTAISIYMLWVLLSQRTHRIFLNAAVLRHPMVSVHVKSVRLLDVKCPYCRDVVIASEDQTHCVNCHTPHHKECWELNGHCTTFGCESQHAQIMRV